MRHSSMMKMALPYRHPIIQQATNSIWFRDRRSEGAMFSEHYYPMSYEAIALVLAVIRRIPIYMYERRISQG
jgi:Domain of unknown function (DUF6532)